MLAPSHSHLVKNIKISFMIVKKYRDDKLILLKIIIIKEKKRKTYSLTFPCNLGMY